MGKGTPESSCCCGHIDGGSLIAGEKGNAVLLCKRVGRRTGRAAAAYYKDILPDSGVLWAYGGKQSLAVCGVTDIPMLLQINDIYAAHCGCVR